MKALRSLFRWLPRYLKKQRNLRRFRKDRDQYKEATGANLLFIEDFLKKRH